VTGIRKKQTKKNEVYAQIANRASNMPEITKEGNNYYIYENEKSRYRIPLGLIISVVIVFACALAIALTHAQITNVERQITQTNRDLVRQREQNDALRTQIGGRYTIDEVEYIALMHLGMSYPDPSQIIEINVPPRSHVRLNTVENILPQENYFWLDLRNFVTGLLNRAIGGQ